MTRAMSDTRLDHETIDWGILNAHLVSPTRLRELASRMDRRSAAEEWIATVQEHARSTRWKVQADGVDRFEPSRKSQEFDGSTVGAAGAAIRFRALTGTAGRAEVVRAFHPVALGLESPLTVAGVAERAGLSHHQAARVLAELSASGFLVVEGGRRRTYAPREHDQLATAFWGIWRSHNYAAWIDAANAVPQLLNMLDATGDDPMSITAHVRWLEMHQDSLTRASGAERSAPSLHGPADDVAAHLIDVSSMYLAALLQRLDEGRGSATRDERRTEEPKRPDPAWTISWNVPRPNA
jgi:hypothetical protein